MVVLQMIVRLIVWEDFVKRTGVVVYTHTYIRVTRVFFAQLPEGCLDM